MRKEIYGYLDKYSIYNPEYTPPDLSFNNLPSALQKSEKFQFLRQKLGEYHTNKKNIGKVNVLSFASEQWKACFFKNLQLLLTEVTYTQDLKVQEDMLFKLQSWYFSKIRLPNIGAPVSELSESPIRRSPYFPETSSRKVEICLPKHGKSMSLDSNKNLKFSRSKLASVHKEMQKLETLHLGTSQTREIILRSFREDKNKDRSFSKSPDPVHDCYMSKMQEKLPSLSEVKTDSTKRTHLGEEFYSEDLREKRIQTPIDFSMLSNDSNYTLRRFPKGGELLMKSPVRPSLAVNKRKK